MRDSLADPARRTRRVAAGRSRAPRRSPTAYDAPMPKPTMNDDFERRSLWAATMPALPDRSARDLPDTADVVVVGGGYAGI